MGDRHQGEHMCVCALVSFLFRYTVSKNNSHLKRLFHDLKRLHPAPSTSVTHQTSEARNAEAMHQIASRILAELLKNELNDLSNGGN